MKRSAVCLVLFVLCLTAFCTGFVAEASGAQPPPKMYRLWHYHGKQGWKHKQNENPNPSHKALHGKGKNVDNRTHVHPKYWNETIKKNTMLFTVTIDDPNIKPSDMETTTLPTFCLHECKGSWVYKTSDASYQKLYDDELAAYPNIECRDPSETCDANEDPPKYFTICAMNTMLGDGTLCCQSKPAPPVPEPVYFPLVIESTRRKHCLLGGCLRGRRTVTFGCPP